MGVAVEVKLGTTPTDEMEVTPTERPPQHPKVVRALSNLAREVDEISRHLLQTARKVSDGTLVWDQKVRQEFESELRRLASKIFSTAFSLPS